MTDFENWLYRVADSTSQRSIAAQVGIQNTALSRWIREDHIPAERVIAIARHYGASIFDGLQAAGYMTLEDMTSGGPVAIADVSSRHLLEELLQRDLRAEAMGATPEQHLEALIERKVAEKLGE